MILNELYDFKIKSIIRSAEDPKLMRKIFKEATQKFSNHPSTASLNWCLTRYNRLTEYDEKMGSTDFKFRTGQIVRFKNKFFGNTFFIQAINYEKQKARIVNNEGFSKIVRFNEIKPVEASN